MRQKVLSKAFFSLQRSKQGWKPSFEEDTPPTVSNALARSSNNPRMCFLAVMVNKKAQLFNHFSATVALEELGKACVHSEQWQIGKAG